MPYGVKHLTLKEPAVSLWRTCWLWLSRGSAPHWKFASTWSSCNSRLAIQLLSSSHAHLWHVPAVPISRHSHAICSYLYLVLFPAPLISAAIFASCKILPKVKNCCGDTWGWERDYPVPAAGACASKLPSLSNSSGHTHSNQSSMMDIRSTAVPPVGVFI